MKIFTIIVTYNPVKWIIKCLDSLSASTIIPNIIIVDNCSKDGSQELIKNNYPNVNLILLNENIGFGQANNIGIQQAYSEGAEYFFLLNQDAWVEPHTLEELIKSHQSQKEFGIVSPIHLNGKGDALDFNFSKYISPKFCDSLYSDKWMNKLGKKIYEVDFVNAAAWFLSRETITKVGGFSPVFFHYGEDRNYVHRLKYHSLKIGVFPYANIYHDREQNNQSEYFLNSRSLRERYIKLNLSNPNIDGYKLVYKIIAKMLIKNLCLLSVTGIKENINDLVKLYKSKKSILSKLNVSKEKGMSFLQEIG